MIRPLLLGFFSVVLLAGLAAVVWWFDGQAWAPRRAKAREEAKQAAIPTPVPEEPGVAAWRGIAAGAESRSIEENIEAARGFLAAHEQSKARADAFELLNSSGRRLLFTDSPAPWKSPYSVVSGDSLAKISSRQKTNMDWIMKVNNLLSHNLAIGQTLLVPKLELSLVADRAAGRLEVHDANGELLSYPMTDSGAAGLSAGQATSVRERFAMSGENRVPFGDPQFAGAEKTIQLAAGASLQALPPPAPPGQAPALPSALLLDSADLEDVYLLVQPGTPVVIR